MMNYVMLVSRQGELTAAAAPWGGAMLLPREAVKELFLILPLLFLPSDSSPVPFRFLHPKSQPKYSTSGKVRLAKWYQTISPKAKAKIVKDVTQLVLARRTRMCNVLEYKGELKEIWFTSKRRWKSNLRPCEGERRSWDRKSKTEMRVRWSRCRCLPPRSTTSTSTLICRIAICRHQFVDV